MNHAAHRFTTRSWLFLLSVCALVLLLAGTYAIATSAGYYDIPLPNWIYEPQGDTSQLSAATNCGPASVVMAVRAATRGSATLKPESVRPHGNMSSMRNTSDAELRAALSYYGVNYRMVTDYADLESAITDRHHIVITLVNMGKIAADGADFRYWNYTSPSTCPNPGHCLQDVHPFPSAPDVVRYLVWTQDRPWANEGRYYTYVGNHWLIAKGKVNNFLNMIVTFDPNVWPTNSRYLYADGSPKGRDRAYLVSDFQTAFNIAGNVGIEILANVDGIPSAPFAQASNEPDEAQLTQSPQVTENITFMAHDNYPAGGLFAPGQTVVKSWHVRNSGQSDVAYEYGLIQVAGTPLSTVGPIKLSAIVLSGEEVHVALEVSLPAQAGSYSTAWKFVDPKGVTFGDALPFNFVVSANASTATPAPSSTPQSTCPTDGRAGIYFYKDQNYQGVCTFTTSDIGDFGSTTVGDNGLSSVQIVGSWEIKIYEDRDFAGRYDVLGQNDPNLDIRSLGGQYSSAKVTSTETTCPTDGRAGVYFYSNTNYQGRCTFSTTNISYFGDTAIGDNDLSSIKFIGDWEAKIYENRDFGGRYDVIGSDDPNLNIRSLGSQYSSVTIRSVIVPPTNTPTPSPTPAPISTQIIGPNINNGGFESGNMSGWTQMNGAFDVASDHPHSGTYYSKGTAATEAWFYRDFDLSQAQAWIDAGLGSTYFSAWFDPGKSENYQLVVRFRDQAGNTLAMFDTGWRYHAGDYAEISGQISLIPSGSRQVRIEVHARRTSGDYTDMDADDISLTLQFQSPAPTPTPLPTATPPTAGYGISINQGALFTNAPLVILSLYAPNAVQMRLSSDGAYLNDNWQAFQPSMSWTISTYGNTAMPRYVFAWYRSDQNEVFGPYFDEIVYDPVPPNGLIRVQNVIAGNKVQLRLAAADDNSGVAAMRLSNEPNLVNAPWQPFAETLTWQMTGSRVYAQFRDRAGNQSFVYSSDPNWLPWFIFLPSVIR